MDQTTKQKIIRLRTLLKEANPTLFKYYASYKKRISATEKFNHVKESLPKQDTSVEV